MAVRLARPDEAATIRRLLVAAFTPFRTRYTAGCFDATVLDEARVLQRMDEGPVWVAEGVPGRVIGTVSAVRDGRGLYVRGLGVDPDARRQGVGRALLEVCEAHARDLGAPGLWLSTTPFLHGSIALYEAFGFQPAEGPKDLRGTPLVSFEKPLEP